MLESIRAVNFQSLQDVEIELGKFTVIVGKSSSGKSAITRAMKAVTSNALHSDYITRGKKKSSVTLKVDGTSVTIEREIGGSSVYKIASSGKEESRYSKLNRQVPAQVTAALGIAPSTKEVASINFAGQFDSPYLLTEGASTVAKVFGELTNVSKIFSAVKEANRLSRAANSVVSVRKKDQAELLDQLKSFSQIGQQAKDLTLAESYMADALKLEADAAALRDALNRAEVAERVAQEFIESVELPDLTDLLDAQKILAQFKSTAKIAIESRRAMQSAEKDIALAVEQHSNAESALHELLVDAGTCPTCNQNIKG